MCHVLIRPASVNDSTRAKDLASEKLQEKSVTQHYLLEDGEYFALKLPPTSHISAQEVQDTQRCAFHSAHQLCYN